ncbi:hypothetical protein [Yoonia sp. 2307UL14-13]|uniref:hypothetical protein n=1 Tax=Yoonia sp. 2307UL14-13 TaxID=3126506 RepID=UPI00309A59D9
MTKRKKPQDSTDEREPNMRIPMLISALLLSACAKTADDIGTANVSSSTYDALSCSQMKSRSRMINEDLAKAEDSQNGGAQFENLIMLGALSGVSNALSDTDEDIATLRGEQIAIRQAFKERGCVA